MKNGIIGLMAIGALLSTSCVGAQDLPMKVKGGHELGETAEQFFAEGHETEVLGACASGDFKSLKKSTKRLAKQYCDQLADWRQRAKSGKRLEYKGIGDAAEFRTDTFTFDGGHLVKVELIYAAPSPEANYKGKSFTEIFAGVKEAYGAPTRESSETTQSVYGQQFVAHREIWVAPHAAIVIAEKPGADGSTTLLAFTREEYDRTMASGKPKASNPLQ
ncbi:MAG: hypothetical protein WA766_10315 [Candidatus Acidiferrales bacterium]|jgi:hypothetical protein